MQVVGVDVIITGEVIVDIFIFLDHVITFQEVFNEIIIFLVLMGK